MANLCFDITAKNIQSNNKTVPPQNLKMRPSSSPNVTAPEPLTGPCYSPLFTLCIVQHSPS